MDAFADSGALSSSAVGMPVLRRKRGLRRHHHTLAWERSLGVKTNELAVALFVRHGKRTTNVLRVESVQMA